MSNPGMDADVFEQFIEQLQRYVRDRLLPAEKEIIESDAIPDDILSEMRDMGLFGLTIPEEYGGAGMNVSQYVRTIHALSYAMPAFRSIISINIGMFCSGLKNGGTAAQKAEWLPRVAAGEIAAFGLTEPGSGSDSAGLQTSAVKTGDGWVLNGTKVFISGARDADFIITIAVTDPAKKARGGMTAFLVDRNTPGLTVPSSFPMIGEYHPYEVHYDSVELDDSQVLGEVGQAFAPLQRRLSIRRAEIAARCLGLARRCITMMIEQANSRSTFGSKLADRQTVQFWIADSYQEMEAVRLAVYRLASRVDRGDSDIRLDGSMVKVQGPEMVGRVIDRAIQLFGGMGVSKELPLEYMSRVTRAYRIVEGPSEIHRWTIGRDLLRNGLPEAR